MEGKEVTERQRKVRKREGKRKKGWGEEGQRMRNRRFSSGPGIAYHLPPLLCGKVGFQPN